MDLDFLNSSSRKRNLETKNRRKDETIITVELRGRYIEEDGKKLILVGLRDITERVRSRKKLEEGERFLRGILTSVREGISVLDADLNIEYVNQTLRERYPEGTKFKGKKCHQVYWGSETPCDPCPSLRALESGEPETEVIEGLPFSNEEWIELTSYPMKNSKTGEIDKVIEFVSDISDRKRNTSKKRLKS